MTRSPLDENRAGRRVDIGSGLRAFVPHPLPPEIEYTPHIGSGIERSWREATRMVAERIPEQPVDACLQRAIAAMPDRPASQG